jgi:hypothetical protein
MQRTKFLGISMTRRSRRRALVVSVYVLLAALIVSVALAHGRNPLLSSDFGGGINFVFVVVFTGISRLGFGSLVRQATVPVRADSRNQWKYISITKPVPYTGPGDPDERELVVRNWAYYLSFRLMAAYLLPLWAVILIVNMKAHSISVNLASALLFPLIVMALTLPQAVVLWTEPDAAVEDGALATVPSFRI